MATHFGKEIRELFTLDPDHVYLNHGARGVAPRKVQEARQRLLREFEMYPDTWFRKTRDGYWDENIKAAATFLHADPDNLAFVQNTVAGLNSVLKTLGLKQGDAILTYSWQYKAIMNTCYMTARHTGCEVVTATVKLPIHCKEDIIDLYREALEKYSNIKVAVLELICSPTATVLPVQELAALCKQHGVTVVVDGAHGPGHVPLDLEALGAAGVDCFIGNFHKWLFAPMGCAVVWIHPFLHNKVRPAITSHVLDSKTPGPCFRAQGIKDDTPWYAAKSAISFYEEIGGMKAVIQYNKQLMDDAVSMLVEEWNASKFPIPADMEAPCMRLITIPEVSSLALEASPQEVFTNCLSWNDALMERFGISGSVLVIHGVTYTRLSANIYNTLDDYKKLADAVKTLVQEELTPEH